MALFVYRRWHVRHADRRIRMDRTDRGCDLSRDRGGCSLLALTLNFGERCRIDDPINGQRSRQRRIVNRLRRRLGPRYRDRRRRLRYRRWPGRVGRRHGWRPRRWNRLWTLSAHVADAPVVFRHRKGKPLWTRRSPTWPHRVGITFEMVLYSGSSVVAASRSCCSASSSRRALRRAVVAFSARARK